VPWPGDGRRLPRHRLLEQTPPTEAWSGSSEAVGTSVLLDLRLSRGAALEVSVVDDAGTPWLIVGSETV
jgi:hypothetical protein